MSAAVHAATISVKQTGATYSSIQFSWNRVSGAKKYQVLYYRYGSTENNASNPIVKWVTGTSTSLRKLPADSVMCVAVGAVGKKGNSICYTKKYTPMGTTPGALSNLKVRKWSSDGKSCTVTMPENKYPNTLHGIEWKVYKGKKLIKKGTKTGTIEFSPSGLTASRCYSLKVRGWLNAANSKKYYGPWHSYVLVPQPTGMNGIISDDGKSTLSWKRVAGVTYYDVYVARGNATSGYKKVASKVKTNKVTISSLKGASFRKDTSGYSFYVVAKKVLNGKTYVSPGNNYLHYWYKTTES